jgi:hypothetical protein
VADMKTFEDCLAFIENELDLQLLAYQKEMLQKLYENEHYYFLPGRDYGRTIFLTAAKLLEEMKRES